MPGGAAMLVGVSGCGKRTLMRCMDVQLAAQQLLRADEIALRGTAMVVGESRLPMWPHAPLLRLYGWLRRLRLLRGGRTDSRDLTGYRQVPGLIFVFHSFFILVKAIQTL